MQAKGSIREKQYRRGKKITWNGGSVVIVTNDGS